MANKRGRPRKAEGEVKDRLVGFRLDPATYQALLDVTKAKGRKNWSISQELLARIRRSFEEDRAIIERFGGPANYAFLRALAGLMAVFSNESGHAAWQHDRELGLKFRYATLALIDRLLPPGPAETDVEAAIHEAEAICRASDYLIGVIRAPDELPPPPADPTYARIKQDLGPILERMMQTRSIAIVTPDGVKSRLVDNVFVSVDGEAK